MNRDTTAERRTLLGVGHFSARQRARLSLIADEAALQLELVASADQAQQHLRSSVPHSILVDASLPECEAFCCDTRASAELAQVPLITLHADLDDLSFASTFSWGGDDAVSLDRNHGLVQRLRRLPQTPLTLPTADRGEALVAEAEHTRRVVLGNVLRSAGYSVTFAVSADDARTYAASTRFGLVIVNAELEPEPRAALDAARSAGNLATWIVTCPPKRLAELQKALVGADSAVVTDGFGPPENVLFLANELGRSAGLDNRASARLLYGTRVAFRGAGLERDEVGFSYNISLGGLYVRTLNPPSEDVVWLELTPPRSDRRVRLEGQVAWRRAWGPNGSATVPPGFGVQITDGTSRNIEGWREGYKAFSRSIG